MAVSTAEIGGQRRGPALKILRVPIVLVMTAAALPASAGTLTPCFTPGGKCTDLIVHEIDSAKSELLVQAYSFTSLAIVEAIARAKSRGVDVGVILDRSNETGRYSGATYLENHGIEPLIDNTVTIAHNKVLVIDGTKVVTGSFNFTKAAQERNAENVLVIEGDPKIAEAYRKNWKRRAGVSRNYAR
jgi:phosphatidylserine/phosphatidylglycerophosphate/cardiolipin synthase-like enzyme